MASAIAFDVPKPAGTVDDVVTASSTSYAHPSPAFSSNLAPSTLASPFIAALVNSSTHSPSLNASPSNSPSLSHTGPFPTSFGALEGAAAAAKHSVAGSARLHKKSPVHKRRSSDASASPDVASAYDTQSDLYYGDASSPFHASSGQAKPKDKLKKNLRKLSLPTKDENTDAIDLSRTTAENEELSGLAIQSPVASSPLTHDFGHSAVSGSRSHARSFSVNSQLSNVSTSFKPSEPFAQPMTYSPQLCKSPTLDTFQEVADTTDGENAEDVKEYEPEAEAKPKGDACPPARHQISQSPGGLMITSIANDESVLLALDTSPANSCHPPSMVSAAFVHPSHTLGTTTSVATDSPHAASRTSSMMLGTEVSRSRTAPDLGEASREASIQAARQAFAQRQEAKTRKYERKEQKAKEKRLRRVSKGGQEDDLGKDESAAVRSQQPTPSTKEKVTPTEAETFGKSKQSRSYSGIVAWLKLRLKRNGVRP